MDPSDLRLDGNAAAGILAQIFAVDVTTAVAACDGCGAAAQIGALTVYQTPMGTIIRCAGCDAAMIRLTEIRGDVWLDLRGTRTLRVARTED